jgi:hypothetical protein
MMPIYIMQIQLSRRGPQASLIYISCSLHAPKIEMGIKRYIRPTFVFFFSAPEWCNSFTFHLTFATTAEPAEPFCQKRKKLIFTREEKVQSKSFATLYIYYIVAYILSRRQKPRPSNLHKWKMIPRSLAHFFRFSSIYYSPQQFACRIYIRVRIYT